MARQRIVGAAGAAVVAFAIDLGTMSGA